MIFKLHEATEEVLRQQFTKDVAKLREELDNYYNVMNAFPTFDSAEIFQCLAAFTARVSFLRAQIMRIPEHRMMTTFRIKELDPFLEECDRQFKVWSRSFSVQSQEWEMTKGL